MSPELDELLKKALYLSTEERGSLAASLLDSLDEGGNLDQDMEAAWQKDVARRMDEIRAGKVKTVPWTEVRSKARAMLDSK